MSLTATPIVHVDRGKSFTSSMIPTAALQRLESTFRGGPWPWWRDRWCNPKFRIAARDVLRDQGGLVIIGPGMSFEVPPPFPEMFEPIEVGRGIMGDETDRLKTLSGDAPTGQERLLWLALIFGTIALLGLSVPFLLRRMPFQGAAAVGLMIVLSVAATAGGFTLQRRIGRWFLIPGAIAIVRKPTRRGQPTRVTVLARVDTCLVFRIIHTGKATILFVELWTHLSKCLRRAVSVREAMSILAAWQSPVPSPPDEKLQELVIW